jgi:hypothetical protein
VDVTLETNAELVKPYPLRVHRPGGLNSKDLLSKEYSGKKGRS